MASGKLGNAALAITTDTTLYTTPAGIVATATVSLCNRGPSDVRVRLAVAAANAPTVAEYIEFDASLPAGGVLERTGVVCGPGEKIVVRADTANVSARAHGFEEVA